MFPISAKTGELWKAENSHAMLRTIRADVIAELRARDAKSGIPVNGKVYTELEAEHRLEVNQELSRAKHTGAETTALIQNRWAEFCSKPQDEDGLAAKAIKTEREAEIAAVKKASAIILKAPRVYEPSVEAAEHKCNHCGKICASAGALTNHERVHG